MNEIPEKEKKIRALMDKKGIHNLCLMQSKNFYWFTGGKENCVDLSSETGVASILLTPGKKYVLTNAIEYPRMTMEEKLANDGFEVVYSGWEEPVTALIDKYTAGSDSLGADTALPGAVNLAEDISRLRWQLCDEEIKRYSSLCLDSAKAVERTMRRIRPGLNELEIAGILSEECYIRGIVPLVNLVASDERIFYYRHPIPTGKTVKKYAMVVLCGRRHGLVSAVTRLIHFGKPDRELAEKQKHLLNIEKAFLENTKPGVSAGHVFEMGIKAYENQGFADEWPKHHQGGGIGYGPREFVANLKSDFIISVNQAFAWNPSITGVKIEDTVLVTADKMRILTHTGDWVYQEVVFSDGSVYQRPLILEV